LNVNFVWNAGLHLLQLLLKWPALMFPTATALSALVKDLLGDASSMQRLPVNVRVALYDTTRACIAAFGLSIAEVLAPAVAQCAWAEFHVQKPASAAAPAAVAAARPAKKARKNGRVEPAIGEESREVLLAQHMQRPAVLDTAVEAQVCLECNP
jgi:hypothetical protein